MRVLNTFKKKKNKGFSFKLTSDDDFLSKIVRRKETEDQIGVKVEDELRKIPKITSSFSSPFRFLNHIYARLNSLNSHENKKFKRFSVAPLTDMTPSFITIDATGIKDMNHNKSLSLLELLKNPGRYGRKKEWHRSFKTDRTQVILQFIKIVTVKRIGTKEQARKQRNADAETLAKLNQWRRDHKNIRPKFLIAAGKGRVI